MFFFSCKFQFRRRLKQELQSLASWWVFCLSFKFFCTSMLVLPFLGRALARSDWRMHHWSYRALWKVTLEWIYGLNNAELNSRCQTFVLWWAIKMNRVPIGLATTSYNCVSMAGLVDPAPLLVVPHVPAVCLVKSSRLFFTSCLNKKLKTSALTRELFTCIGMMTQSVSREGRQTQRNICFSFIR